MTGVLELLASAQPAPLQMQEMSITTPEIVLLIAGGVFTIALLTLFVIVLKKELKRDRQNAPIGDSVGDDPSEDDSGG